MEKAAKIVLINFSVLIAIISLIYFSFYVKWQYVTAENLKLDDNSKIELKQDNFKFSTIFKDKIAEPKADNC
jgi:hypothetical protein